MAYGKQQIVYSKLHTALKGTYNRNVVRVAKSERASKWQLENTKWQMAYRSILEFRR